jgi:hypothetical protein
MEYLTKPVGIFRLFIIFYNFYNFLMVYIVSKHYSKVVGSG